jgi:hypothetical protein
MSHYYCYNGETLIPHTPTSQTGGVNVGSVTVIINDYYSTLNTYVLITSNERYAPSHILGLYPGDWRNERFLSVSNATWG